MSAARALLYREARNALAECRNLHRIAHRFPRRVGVQKLALATDQALFESRMTSALWCLLRAAELREFAQRKPLRCHECGGNGNGVVERQGTGRIKVFGIAAGACRECGGTGDWHEGSFGR